MQAVIDIQINTSSVETGIRRATGEVQKGVKSQQSALQKLRHDIMIVGRQFEDIRSAAIVFGKAAGVALAGFGAAAAAVEIIKVGKAFEQTMSAVQGVMGIADKTSAEFQALNDIAKEMGANTEWSANQAAKALHFLGMAGFSASQSVSALPGVLDLATAGNLDLARAADIVTDGLTAMGMSVDELSHFNDVLAKTVTSSNTNIRMMGESLKYVAPIAKNVGMNIEDVSALLGIMANAGLKSGQAGRQLRSALLDIDKAAKAAGVTFTAQEKGYERLTKVLGAMNDKGFTATQVSGAFGKVSSTAMLVLMDALKRGEGGLEAFRNKLNDVDGANVKLSETMRDTVEGAFKSLQSTIEGYSISIFEDFKNTIKDVTLFLVDFARAVKSGFIQTISSAGDIVTGFTKIFKNAFVGDTDVIAYFKNLSDEIGKTVQRISDWVNSDIFQSLGSGILSSMGNIAGTINQAWSDAMSGLDLGGAEFSADGLMGGLVTGMESLNDILNSAKPYLDEFAEYFNKTLDSIVKVVNSVMDNIGEPLAKAFKEGKRIVGEVFSDVFDIVKTSLGGISSWLDKNAGTIGEFFGAIAIVVEEAMSAFGSPFGDAKTGLEGFGDTVSIIVVPALQMFSGWVRDNRESIGGFFGFLSDAFKELIDFAIPASQAVGGFYLAFQMMSIMETATKVTSLWTKATMFADKVMMAFHGSIYSTNVSMLASAGIMGKVALAANVAAAAFAGWKLGEWAYNNFEWARKLGLAFVDGIMQAIIKLSQLWANISLGMSQVWESVWNAIREVAKVALGGFVDGLKLLPNIGGVLDAPIKMFGDMADKISVSTNLTSKFKAETAALTAVQAEEWRIHDESIDSILAEHEAFGKNLKQKKEAKDATSDYNEMLKKTAVEMGKLQAEYAKSNREEKARWQQRNDAIAKNIMQEKDRITAQVAAEEAALIAAEEAEKKAKADAAASGKAGKAATAASGAIKDMSRAYEEAFKNQEGATDSWYQHSMAAIEKEKQLSINAMKAKGATAQQIQDLEIGFLNATVKVREKVIKESIDIYSEPLKAYSNSLKEMETLDDASFDAKLHSLNEYETAMINQAKKVIGTEDLTQAEYDRIHSEIQKLRQNTVNVYEKGLKEQEAFEEAYFQRSGKMTEELYQRKLKEIDEYYAEAATRGVTDTDALNAQKEEEKKKLAADRVNFEMKKEQEKLQNQIAIYEEMGDSGLKYFEAVERNLAIESEKWREKGATEIQVEQIKNQKISTFYSERDKKNESFLKELLGDQYKYTDNYLSEIDRQTQAWVKNGYTVEQAEMLKNNKIAEHNSDVQKNMLSAKTEYYKAVGDTGNDYYNALMMQYDIELEEWRTKGLSEVEIQKMRNVKIQELETQRIAERLNLEEKFYSQLEEYDDKLLDIKRQKIQLELQEYADQGMDITQVRELAVQKALELEQTRLSAKKDSLQNELSFIEDLEGREAEATQLKIDLIKLEAQEAVNAGASIADARSAAVQQIQKLEQDKLKSIEESFQSELSFYGQIEEQSGTLYALQSMSINKQAEEYEKAGRSTVDIEKWKFQEIKKLNDEFAAGDDAGIAEKAKSIAAIASGTVEMYERETEELKQQNAIKAEFEAQSKDIQLQSIEEQKDAVKDLIQIEEERQATVESGIDTAAGLFDDMFGGVLDGWTGMSGNMQNIWQNLLQGIGSDSDSAFGQIFGNLQRMMSQTGSGGGGGSWLDSVIGAFTGGGDSGGKSGGILSGLWKTVSGAFSGDDGILGGISKLWDTGKEWVTGLWNKGTDWAGKLWDTGKSLFSGNDNILSKAVGFFSGKSGGSSDILTSAVNFFSGKGGQGNILQNTLGGSGGGFNFASFGQAYSSFKGLLSGDTSIASLGSAAKSLYDAYSSGKNLLSTVSTAYNAIKSGTDLSGTIGTAMNSLSGGTGGIAGLGQYGGVASGAANVGMKLFSGGGLDSLMDNKYGNKALGLMQTVGSFTKLGGIGGMAGEWLGGMFGDTGAQIGSGIGTGAGIGTAIAGPVGAAVGAVLGGIVSAFGMKGETREGFYQTEMGWNEDFGSIKTKGLNEGGSSEYSDMLTETMRRGQGYVKEKMDVFMNALPDQYVEQLENDLSKVKVTLSEQKENRAWKIRGEHIERDVGDVALSTIKAMYDSSIGSVKKTAAAIVADYSAGGNTLISADEFAGLSEKISAGPQFDTKATSWLDTSGLESEIESYESYLGDIIAGVSRINQAEMLFADTITEISEKWNVETDGILEKFGISVSEQAENLTGEASSSMPVKDYEQFASHREQADYLGGIQQQYGDIDNGLAQFEEFQASIGELRDKYGDDLNKALEKELEIYEKAKKSDEPDTEKIAASEQTLALLSQVQNEFGGYTDALEYVAEETEKLKGIQSEYGDIQSGINAEIEAASQFGGQYEEAMYQMNSVFDARIEALRELGVAEEAIAEVESLRAEAAKSVESDLAAQRNEILNQVRDIAGVEQVATKEGPTAYQAETEGFGESMQMIQDSLTSLGMTAEETSEFLVLWDKAAVELEKEFQNQRDSILAEAENLSGGIGIGGTAEIDTSLNETSEKFRLLTESMYQAGGSAEEIAEIESLLGSARQEIYEEFEKQKDQAIAGAAELAGIELLGTSALDEEIEKTKEQIEAFANTVYQSGGTVEEVNAVLDMMPDALDKVSEKYEEQRTALLEQAESLTMKDTSDIFQDTADTVNKQFDDMRASLIDLGGTVSDVTALENQRNEAIAYQQQKAVFGDVGGANQISGLLNEAVKTMADSAKKRQEIETQIAEAEQAMLDSRSESHKEALQTELDGLYTAIDEIDSTDFEDVGNTVNQKLQESMQNAVQQFAIDKISQQIQENLLAGPMEALTNAMMSGDMDAVKNAYAQIEAIDISGAVEGVSMLMTSLQTGEDVDWDSLSLNMSADAEKISESVMQGFLPGTEQLSQTEEEITSQSDTLISEYSPDDGTVGFVIQSISDYKNQILGAYAPDGAEIITDVDVSEIQVIDASEIFTVEIPDAAVIDAQAKLEGAMTNAVLNAEYEQAVSDKLSEGIETAFEMVSPDTSDIQESVREVYQVMSDVAVSLTDETAFDLESALSDMFADASSTIITGAGDTSFEAQESLYDMFSQMSDILISDGANTASEAQSALSGLFDEMLNTLTAGGNMSGAEAYNQIISVFNNMISAAVTGSSAAGMEASSAIADVMSQVEAAISMIEAPTEVEEVSETVGSTVVYGLPDTSRESERASRIAASAAQDAARAERQRQREMEQFYKADQQAREQASEAAEDAVAQQLANIATLRQFNDTLDDTLGVMSETDSAIRDLNYQWDDNIAKMKEAGADTEMLARAEQAKARQIQDVRVSALEREQEAVRQAAAESARYADEMRQASAQSAATRKAISRQVADTLGETTALEQTIRGIGDTWADNISQLEETNATQQEIDRAKMAWDKSVANTKAEAEAEAEAKAKSERERLQAESSRYYEEAARTADDLAKARREELASARETILGIQAAISEALGGQDAYQHQVAEINKKWNDYSAQLSESQNTLAQFGSKSIDEIRELQKTVNEKIGEYETSGQTDRYFDTLKKTAALYSEEIQMRLDGAQMSKDIEKVRVKELNDARIAEEKRLAEIAKQRESLIAQADELSGLSAGMPALKTALNDTESQFASLEEELRNLEGTTSEDIENVAALKDLTLSNTISEFTDNIWQSVSDSFNINVSDKGKFITEEVSEFQAGVAEINTAFDEWIYSVGGLVDTAKLEKARDLALKNLKKTAIEAVFEESAGLKRAEDVPKYQAEIIAANESFGLLKERLKDIGAGSKAVAKLEKERNQVLKQIEADRLAEIKVLYDSADEVISGFKPDEMSEYARQVQEVNDKFADITASAVELSVTEEELSALRTKQTEALLALSEKVIRDINTEVAEYKQGFVGEELSEYQQNIADINKSFETWSAGMAEAGASLEQINALEADRADILASVRSDAVDSVFDTISEFSGADFDSIGKINDAFKQQEEVLADIGDAQSELNKLDRQRLALIDEFKEAKINEKFEEIDDYIAGFGFDDSRSEFKKQYDEMSAVFNRHVEDLKLLEASEEDIDKVNRQRIETLNALKEAELDVIRTEAADYKASFMPEDSSEYQNTTDDITANYTDFIARIGDVSQIGFSSAADALAYFADESNAGMIAMFAESNESIVLLAQTAQDYNVVMQAVTKQALENIQNEIDDFAASYTPELTWAESVAAQFDEINSTFAAFKESLLELNGITEDSPEYISALAAEEETLNNLRMSILEQGQANMESIADAYKIEPDFTPAEQFQNALSEYDAAWLETANALLAAGVSQQDIDTIYDDQIKYDRENMKVGRGKQLLDDMKDVADAWKIIPDLNPAEQFAKEMADTETQLKTGLDEIAELFGRGSEEYAAFAEDMADSLDQMKSYRTDEIFKGVKDLTEQYKPAELDKTASEEFNDSYKEAEKAFKDYEAELNSLYGEGNEFAKILAVQAKATLELMKEGFRSEMLAASTDLLKSYIPEDNSLQSQIENLNSGFNELTSNLEQLGGSEEEIAKIEEDRATALGYLTESLQETINAGLNETLASMQAFQDEISGITAEDKVRETLRSFESLETVDDIQAYVDAQVELYNTQFDKLATTWEGWKEVEGSAKDTMTAFENFSIEEISGIPELAGQSADDVAGYIEGMNEWLNKMAETRQGFEDLSASLRDDISKRNQAELESGMNQTELIAYRDEQIAQGFQALQTMTPDQALVQAEKLRDLILEKGELEKSALDETVQSAESLKKAAESVGNQVEKIKYSDLNLAYGKEKTGIITADYQTMLASAQTGGADDVNAYIAQSEVYLEEMQKKYGSSGAYLDIYNQVMSDMSGLQGKTEEAAAETQISEEAQRFEALSEINSQTNSQLEMLAGYADQQIQTIDTSVAGQTEILSGLLGEGGAIRLGLDSTVTAITDLQIAVTDAITTGNMMIATVVSGQDIDMDSLPQFEKGGIFSGSPEGSLAVLHNTEAVIPLNGQEIPLIIKQKEVSENDDSEETELMREQLAELKEQNENLKQLIALLVANQQSGNGGQLEISIDSGSFKSEMKKISADMIYQHDVRGDRVKGRRLQ